MTLSKNTIKIYRSLKQKKYRDKEGLFIIEGKKLVKETLEQRPELVNTIVCTENTKYIIPQPFISKTITGSYNSIKEISALKSPQEILAIVNKPTSQIKTASTIDDLTLVLDNISDPGNLGTIIRLADWFGIKNIVCSNNTVDCFNPKVVQASMGGILRTNIYYTEIQQYISDSVKANVPIYGSILEGRDMYQENLKSPALLVMGNESEGISDEVRKLLSHELLIPSFNKNNNCESLNVSTATAILLGEFRRQSNYSK